MYPRETVELAKLLSDLEILDRENAAICDVSIAAVRHWRRGSRRMAGAEIRREAARCPRRHARTLDKRAYSYLLGLYLGDGHLTRGKRDVYALSITCGDMWPGLMAQARMTMSAVMPDSDGCRLINRVRRPARGGDRWYEYPRYLFVNRSADIHRLCGEALDRLEVAWRFSKPTTISVARREAVARLDEFVGPKY
jgi:hypothetical protein